MKGIDRQAIVAAAFDVLAERGLAGMTVRAVAVRLDVQAPALYWHVRDKKDLLDEMSTELWRRILADVPPATDVEWREAMRGFATVMRRVLLGVRDGARVFGGAYLTDASLIAAQERNLESLVAQGFELHRATLAWRLLYDFTLGFCIEEQEVMQSRDGRYDLDERDARIDAARYPLVARAGRDAFGDPEGSFDELLGAVLSGAEALRS